MSKKVYGTVEYFQDLSEQDREFNLKKIANNFEIEINDFIKKRSLQKRPSDKKFPSLINRKITSRKDFSMNDSSLNSHDSIEFNLNAPRVQKSGTFSKQIPKNISSVSPDNEILIENLNSPNHGEQTQRYKTLRKLGNEVRDQLKRMIKDSNSISKARQNDLPEISLTLVTGKKPSLNKGLTNENRLRTGNLRRMKDIPEISPAFPLNKTYHSPKNFQLVNFQLVEERLKQGESIKSTLNDTSLSWMIHKQISHQINSNNNNSLKPSTKNHKSSDNLKNNRRNLNSKLKLINENIKQNSNNLYVPIDKTENTNTTFTKNISQHNTLKIISPTHNQTRFLNTNPLNFKAMFNMPKDPILKKSSNKIASSVVNSRSLAKDNILFNSKMSSISQDASRKLDIRSKVFDSNSDKEESHSEGEYNFAMNPDSTVRRVFEILLTICFYVNCIFSIHKLAFPLVGFIKVNIVIDLIIDFIFIADVALGFITGFYNFYDDYINSIDGIILRYFKQWFLLDIIASIPFHSIFNFIELQMQNQDDNIELENFYINPFHLLKLNRLLKAIKLENVNTNYLISRISEFCFRKVNNSEYIRLLKLSWYLIICTHVLSCIWIFVGNLDNPNWMTEIFLGYQETSFSIYIDSVYFNLLTIYTVGYGDITFVHKSELLFNIFLLVFSIIMYTLIVSNVSNLVQEKDYHTKLYLESVDFLENARIQYRIPVALYKQIKNYLKQNYLFYRQDKNYLIRDLPSASMRNEMTCLVYENLIHSMKFFRYIKFYDSNGRLILQSPQFAVRVISSLKAMKLKRNEYIIEVGEYFEELIFIKKGLVSVESEYNDNIIKLIKLHRGEHFGDVCIILNKKSDFSLRVKSKVAEIYLMKKIELTKISEEFKEIFENIYRDSAYNMLVLQTLKENTEKELQIDRHTTTSLKNSKKSKVKIVPVNVQSELSYVSDESNYLGTDIQKGSNKYLNIIYENEEEDDEFTNTLIKSKSKSREVKGKFESMKFNSKANESDNKNIYRNYDFNKNISNKHLYDSLKKLNSLQSSRKNQIINLNINIQNDFYFKEMENARSLKQEPSDKNDNQCNSNRSDNQVNDLQISAESSPDIKFKLKYQKKNLSTSSENSWRSNEIDLQLDQTYNNETIIQNISQKPEIMEESKYSFESDHMNIHKNSSSILNIDYSKDESILKNITLINRKQSKKIRFSNQQIFRHSELDNIKLGKSSSGVIQQVKKLPTSHHFQSNEASPSPNNKRRKGYSSEFDISLKPVTCHTQYKKLINRSPIKFIRTLTKNNLANPSLFNEDDEDKKRSFAHSIKDVPNLSRATLEGTKPRFKKISSKKIHRSGSKTNMKITDFKRAQLRKQSINILKEIKGNVEGNHQRMNHPSDYYTSYFSQILNQADDMEERQIAELERIILTIKKLIE